MTFNKYLVLLKYIAVVLSLIAAVEYFKYGTRINYEWFHCTPIYQDISPVTKNAKKLFSVGGPSCDKRGEFKTIVKRITRDYEVNDDRITFCIIENLRVSPVHYPVEDDDKGEPGYYAYIANDSDFNALELITEKCLQEESILYHM
ncbi:related to Ceramide synthase subunit LIP1 [Saccharomycodes ludwigii]|uniref:Related to Ceramide synthase subunit LIP1 n=1 Tax=Saccharomycodes ludwigii TaxID=36035 RepID=A0A376B7X6_9ASCO|nr:hypothetical protein SCDLUD_004849 [Saccharomycodes ludwigii]KAH3899406.1 hypothetical protein SCDLUD_004849 [Saccharomycodes ludwigii]SSD60711.1 related to Ceramide synthase subunit LIP1 [Saccharomycodes ludwigii]